MGEFHCWKVSFSFFFFNSVFLFAIRPSGLWQISLRVRLTSTWWFFQGFLCHTLQGVSEQSFTCPNENAQQNIRNIAFDVVFDHYLVKVSAKVLRLQVLRWLVTTVFRWLPVRYTTFYNSSQFFTRDETF